MLLRIASGVGKANPELAEDLGLGLLLGLGAMMVVPIAGIVAGVGVQLASSSNESGSFLLRFSHADAPDVRLASAPWFWVLAFGGFYFLVKRVWIHAAILLAVAFLADWSLGVLYTPFANRILRRHEAGSGWTEVQTEAPQH